jgi:hypothetical protein
MNTNDDGALTPPEGTPQPAASRPAESHGRPPDVPPEGRPGRGRPDGPALRRLAVLGPDVRGQELPPARYEGRIPFGSAVLERHGGVLLRPAEVTRLPDRPAPGSTAYRAAVLLVAEDVAQDDAFYERANGLLTDLGVWLVKPAPIAGDGGDQYGGDGDGTDGEQLRPFRERFADLPRPVAITVRPGAGPRRVDAWPVLQTLRSAGMLADRPNALGLDHLLVGSAMVSIGGSPGAVEGSPGAVEGSPGPAVYLRPGTGGRVPLAVLLAPPRPSPTCRHRRPVVAVLDTGISDPVHPWLAGVVRTDPVVQALVLDAEVKLQATQADPVQLLTTAVETPFNDDDFVQDIDTHAGHGTFIAGLIRQVAPDALVTAIRVMHSDGVVYEGDLLAALRAVRVRNQEARKKRLPDGENPPDGQVDVVVLSLGYFDERGEAEALTSELATELNALAADGVLVVAAAGNYSTDRPFYPAALAAAPPGDGPPVISVGAWNPNGSKALFSDDGQWVTGWALGAAVVSTYPDFQGASQPDMGQGQRETLDTDDYRGGFAEWSGTSFAAPVLAAELAELLFAYSERHDELSLADNEVKAAVGRVNNALETLRKQA